MISSLLLAAEAADGLGGLLPLLGSGSAAVAVIVVVVYFLRHLGTKDEIQQKLNLTLVERCEAIATTNRDAMRGLKDEFLAALKESRAEAQQNTAAFIGLNREAILTMGSLSQKVEGLGKAIDELRSEMKHKEDKRKPTS